MCRARLLLVELKTNNSICSRQMRASKSLARIFILILAGYYAITENMLENML